MKAAVHTTTPRRILFVFAHPDDETLTAGTTIAHYARSGDDVIVITCTRGERGEVIPERLAHLADDPAALAAHRDLELREALAALGVTKHAYLGSHEARQLGAGVRMYRDTGMETAQDGTPRLPGRIDPESLCAAPLDEIAGDIASVIEREQPEIIVTENAYGGYGHPDHIRTHDAVVAALTLLDDDDMPSGLFVAEHPARVTAQRAAAVRERGTFKPSPVNPRAVIADKLVDVTIHDPETRIAKTNALRAHGSQLDVRDGEFCHSDGRGETIEATEYFREIGGRITRADARSTSDFFVGWDRVFVRADGTMLNARTGTILARPVNRGRDAVTFALAIVLGIVLGAIAAVGHRATLTAGDAEIPVGFSLTLITILLAHIAVRLVSLGRLPVVGLAVGTVTAIAVLTMAGPGGSVIFPAKNIVLADGNLQAVDNTTGMIWLFLAVVTPIIVALWPSVGASSMLPRRIMERTFTSGGKL